MKSNMEASWIKKEPKSPNQRLVQRTIIGGTSYDEYGFVN